MKSKYIRTILFSIMMVLGMTACKGRNYSSSHPSYVIMDADGDQIDYKQLVSKIRRSDVCLFGELHNDPISHWLELSLVKDLFHAEGEHLVVGAEMWERDNQHTLDEFLVKKYFDLNTYIENSRLWKNFTTDYKPILQYVSENGIRFQATNVPRRYANMVSSYGFGILDSLDTYAKEYFAPLPLQVDYNERVYSVIAESFKQMSSMPMKKRDVSHLVEAQVLKDATMAHFICSSLGEDDLFFHFHGEMHSAYHSAIQYFIRQYAPDTKVVTISVVMAEDIQKYRPKEDRADFYVVVPFDMTRTYEN